MFNEGYLCMNLCIIMYAFDVFGKEEHNRWTLDISGLTWFEDIPGLTWIEDI